MIDNITVGVINKRSCNQFHEIIGLNKIDDENLYVIGVYKKNDLVGILSYYDEKEILIFNKIYIIPYCRKKGYGTLLVDELKKIASKSKVSILAKLFNTKREDTDNALNYLSKCGFDKPILKNIYFIIDFQRIYQSFIQRKFDDSIQIINETYKTLSYKEIKEDQKLFTIIKNNSEEFNSFSYLDENQERFYDSFFIHDNEVLGWFVFEIKPRGHIQIDSVFSNPKYRYSIIGFRFFKLLFDQCYALAPDALTVSFSVDPNKKELLHTYNIIFKDAIINTVNVWYSYCYLNEN